ncbi:MAG: hypothetical protein Fur009_0770 [Candidatus Microgenomates bacterium]
MNNMLFSQNEKSKKQLIFTRINDLFRRIVETKNRESFLKFLRFIKRFNNRSPFNNALIFAQNPNCFYWATETQWKKLGRSIKENARPMVVLYPFGPVEFVYNYEDTEGKPITEERFLYWWKEDEKTARKLEIELVFNKTVEFLEKHHIKVKIPEKNNLKEYSFHDTALGVASVDKENINRKQIYLHVKYSNNQEIVEAYGTLVHEIAHYFLGHLGSFIIKKEIKKDDKIIVNEKRLCDNRSYVNKNIKELEAELTAWIVFALFNIEKNSEIYLASYLINQEDFSNIDFSLVFKTGWTIREIGVGNFKF